MHTDTRHRTRRLSRAFTLVELLTAMAVTAILVVLIMQLTSQSVQLWKSTREDTSTAAVARNALQTMCRDLESTQLRSGRNKYQWISAEVDGPMKGLPKGLNIPRSARLIFFTCTPDRNPAIRAEGSGRSSYRSELASNPDTQGDISAVSYRLLFRDQVLNLTPGKNSDHTMFPVFALYRNVVSPRETFERLLGQENLPTVYTTYESEEERHFLCDNIIDMSLIFHLEYTDDNAGGGGNERSGRKSVTVPILATSARRGKQSFSLYSDHATSGQEFQNARIYSVEVAITVLTEEGMALIEQVRLGQRRPPKLEEFYSRFTRSFSRTVALPMPL